MSNLFIDPVFPADHSSLCFDPDYKKPDFFPAVKSWRRPREWSPNSQLFLDSSHPGDVQQGALGDCWLLSAFSVVALYPAILKKLFVEIDTKIGKYTLRLYLDSKWHDVTIDDRIPCGSNGLPCFGHNTLKNELWVVILEKAVAKLLGCYEALHGGYTEEGIVLITGGRPERIYTNNWKQKIGRVQLRKDRLWQKLVTYFKENVMVGCSISSGKEEKDYSKGIVAGHAYGILEARETSDKKHKLLHIRNPWGCFEWKGDWSDYSRRWTPQYRKELNHVAKDDGQFWMSFDDFCKVFDKICCCRVFSDVLITSKQCTKLPLTESERKLSMPFLKWNRVKLEGAWDDKNAGGLTSGKLGFAKNPHLKLNIPKSGRYFLVISRAPIDQNVEAQYYRSSIGFTLHKGVSTPYYEIPSQNSDTGFLNYPVCGRFNAIEMELEQDDYIITPTTLYPNRKGVFIFEVYGEHDFSLSPLPDGSEDVIKEAPPSVRGERDDRSGYKVKLQSSFISKPVAQHSAMQNDEDHGTFAMNTSTASLNSSSSKPSSKYMSTYQYEFSRRKML